MATERCGRDAGAFQAQREMMRSLLAGLIFVLVEGDVDGTAWLLGKLRPLSGRQLRADGAGGVAKTGLPQHGQIEQTFDQDHGGEAADRLPGEQSAFGARQQAVGNAAPILRP